MSTVIAPARTETAEHPNVRPTANSRPTQVRSSRRGRALRLSTILFPILALSGDVGGALLAHRAAGATGAGLIVIALGIYGVLAVGGYRETISVRVLDTLPKVLMALGLSGLAVTIGLELAPWIDVSLEVGVLMRMMAYWLLLMVAGRALSHGATKALRKRGVVERRALVVGMSDRALQMTGTLVERPSLGVKPVGFVAAACRDTGDDLPAPYLGTVEALPQLVSELEVDHVIVDAASMSPRLVTEAVHACDRADVEVYVAPLEADLVGVATSERIGTVSLVHMPRRTFRTSQWYVKRAFDIAVSLAALIVLAPIMVVAGFLVTRETGAGLLFRQQRVGLDGRTFDVLKFQTMVPATSTESATQWNIANDSRLGPVGKFLRRTSIDELPQLFNILRGDMSIVGPRPERPHFVEQFSSEHQHYMSRHRVPAGLTGLAAVEGLRGDTSISHRAAMDNLYIEQWSLWLDMKIMLRTVPAVLRGEGG